jgi:starch-binding outer membrane protein, SusD/RagB family
MKKYLIFTFTIIILSAGLSCSKLLEERPVTFLGDQAVYNTEEGAEAAIVGLYSRLNNLENFGLYFWQLVPPLSGTIYSSVATWQDLISLNPTLNNERVNGFWTECYATVNIANDIITKLPSYNINPTAKNNILGQAYFIRAMTYFNLVRLWGGVPLRLAPSTSATIHIKRAPAEEVWEAITNDLKQSKQLLAEPTNQKKSRPHKYAAYALLAKVYMTRASMSLDENSPFWLLAYNEATEVYNSQAYQLVKPYSALWLPGNENTSEAIFEIQQSTQTSEWKTQIYLPTAHPLLKGGTAGGTYRSNKEIYDGHVSQYPGDPRLETYLDSQYTRTDNNVNVLIYPRNKTTQGWPYMIKYYSANRSGFSAEKNFIFFRYAELLLMLAEIENELRGPTGAYKYINEVLVRARDTNGDGVGDVPQPANWAGLTKENFRLRIMQERMYEMRGEGQEWFETHRRGYDYFLTQVIRKHNNNPSRDLTRDFVYPENSRNMLLPIPSVEINTNQLIGPSDQNPGF